MKQVPGEVTEAGSGTMLITLAGLCWGVSGGIAGILMADGWDAFQVAWCRGAIGLLCVLLWLAVNRRDSGLGNPRLWLWSVVAGAGVAGNFSFYFLSIAHGSVAVAATLMYSAPVFVFLVSFLLRIEPSTGPKWAAMVLVTLGIVLLTGLYNAEAGGVTLIAAGAGLASGLSYALFIFGFKFAAPHGSPQAILVVAFAVLAGLLAWPGNAFSAVNALKSTAWPLFVMLGVLGAGLSFYLYIGGLRRCAPAIASVVAMVEPVTAALFGVVVLGERLAPTQIVGMALILATVTMLSVHANRQRPAA